MTLAKAKVRAYKTYIAQASLTIITYDRQNIFIVEATSSLFKALSSKLKIQSHRCHDTQHNDTQHNDTQHNDIMVKCRMTTSSATSSSAAPSHIGMKYTVFAAYYYIVA